MRPFVPDQMRLYKLIYERFVASRMAAAVYDTLQIILEKDGFEFTSTGSKLVFAGFLQVYKEQEEEQEKFETIEGLETGDEVQLKSVEPQQHFTQPPPRYTEAALVKALEDNGVGRHSTYAPTIATLIARTYLAKEKKVLYVTELGMIVNQMISQYFSEIVDIRFTAGMEEKLDKVEEGEVDWRTILQDFYVGFEPLVEKASNELEKVQLEDEVTDVICEKCGRRMVIKTGRYGKFIACPGYPECKNIKKLVTENGAECPKCGGRVVVKKTKKGRVFYGCSEYPKCDFVSWDEPVQEKCPRCGKTLLRKKGKKPKLYCITPDCGYERTEEPAE